MWTDVVAEQRAVPTSANTMVPAIPFVGPPSGQIGDRADIRSSEENLGPITPKPSPRRLVIKAGGPILRNSNYRTVGDRRDASPAVAAPHTDAAPPTKNRIRVDLAQCEF